MLQEYIRPQLKGKSESEVYQIILNMEKYYNVEYNPFKDDYKRLTEEEINWYLDNKVK